MGEIQIVTMCDNCQTEFDEDDDTEQCMFCKDTFCDDCQQEHSQSIIFQYGNKEIETYLLKEKQGILKMERNRVRKKND